jgi:hypothetical protein
MKKLLLTLLACLAFAGVGKAQNDLQSLIAEFPEITAPILKDEMMANTEKDLDKALSLKYLSNMSDVLATHPVGFYKRNDKVGVFIFSLGNKNGAGYLVCVATVNLKTSKKIDYFFSITSFTSIGSLESCLITVRDENKTIVCQSYKEIYKLEISESGKIKQIK